jgi:hypothetical protein
MTLQGFSFPFHSPSLRLCAFAFNFFNIVVKNYNAITLITLFI